MNREKEILLELLLEKYGQQNTKPMVETLPLVYVKKRKTRSKAVPTVYSCERWTVEGIAMVHKMLLNNMKTHEIAKAIGRSQKSIVTIKSALVGNRAKKSPVVQQYLASKQTANNN